MPGNDTTSPEVVHAVAAAVPPQAEQRKMFGHPAAKVGGHMFLLLVDGELGLKLSEAHRAEALALDGAESFVPRGRHAFKEMVRMPEAMLGDAKALRRWVGRACDYAASLPPKK